jgi:large subunit ribosomal protein L2
MKLKTFKPTTPSSRNLIRLNNIDLQNSPLLKNQIKGSKNSAGKNSTGRITAYHRGGGHKKRYRKINFNRTESSTAIVTSIEYDPCRSSNIASIYDIKRETYCYILSPKNLKVGDIIKSGKEADSKNGHSLSIAKIPVGTLIHNVSIKSKKKSQVSRAAGTFSQLLEKTSNSGRLKLSSGKQQMVSVDCFATIGVVSNELSFLTTIGKAGRSRWLNKRPTVRGVAMNPIDHPHGGGEGKTSGGKSSVTPWGKPTKGGKTSRSKNKLILQNKT